MINRFTVLFLFTFSVFASGSQQRVSFMTYNVENLFDTEHDKGKLDYTYLPLSVKRGRMKQEVTEHCRTVSSPRWKKECFEWDWNEVVLHEKLARLAGVIRDVSGSLGVGPDVFILEETENLNVLNILNQRYLSDLGYKIVFKEGWDARGIDVAVFTKLEIQRNNPAILHRVPNSRHRLRGILQANLLLPDQTPLSVFALHMPSPGNPRAAREDVLKYLNELKKRLPSETVVVAGGDFNVTGDEEKRYQPIRRYMSKAWHAVTDSCTGCKGTSYYPPKRTWSFLDRFFVGKTSSPWQLDSSSVFVQTESKGQVDRSGFPIRFHPGKGRNSSGISDHLPLVFELNR